MMKQRREDCDQEREEGIRSDEWLSFFHSFFSEAASIVGSQVL